MLLCKFGTRGWRHVGASLKPEPPVPAPVSRVRILTSCHDLDLELCNMCGIFAYYNSLVEKASPVPYMPRVMRARGEVI